MLEDGGIEMRDMDFDGYRRAEEYLQPL